VELEIGVGFVRNKSNAIDIFGTTLGFTKKVKDKPLVDFLVFFNILIDLKNESSPIVVIRVLPSRIYAFPEIVNGTDESSFTIGSVPKLAKNYEVYRLLVASPS
jgi:F420-0:gamma-glutamyl ligase